MSNSTDEIKDLLNRLNSNPQRTKLIQDIERLKKIDDVKAKNFLEVSESFLKVFDKASQSEHDERSKLVDEYFLSLSGGKESKRITIDTNGVPVVAIKLIQEFEGLADIKSQPPMVKAYPDPKSGGEPYTIGWGTTVYPGGQKVKENDLKTREEIDKFFIKDLKNNYWDRIKEIIPNWDGMNDEMRSALCSFAYNLGAGFYGTSGFNTISNCLRDKEWDSVAQAMLLYVNPGSSVEAGLRRRRGAEGDLWLKGLTKIRTGTTSQSSKSKIIRARQYTFLKKENKDSQELEANQLKSVISGKYYEVDEFVDEQGNNQQIRLEYNAGTWWIFKDHWNFSEAESNENVVLQRTFDNTKGILKVPYLSQNDNVIDPYETCNVTCVAMCLRFYGVKGDGSGQLEDQLMKTIRRKSLNRGNPEHLKQLVDEYPNFNLSDEFTFNGSFKKIRDSIDQGYPVIIHGMFTPPGHIIVVKGYDDNGFIVNDPHGEYFSWGYDRSKSGDGLHYSYSLIAKVCSPESMNNPSNIWMHSIKK